MGQVTMGQVTMGQVTLGQVTPRSGHTGSGQTEVRSHLGQVTLRWSIQRSGHTRSSRTEVRCHIRSEGHEQMVNRTIKIWFSGSGLLKNGKLTVRKNGQSEAFQLHDTRWELIRSLELIKPRRRMSFWAKRCKHPSVWKIVPHRIKGTNPAQH